MKWGVDLQSEHERFLTEKHAKPVIVMNYPKAIKAFMRQNDDGQTVAAMDVLALASAKSSAAASARSASNASISAWTRSASTKPGLVPRSAPLRDRAARGLRPGLRAHRILRHGAFQRARRDPISRARPATLDTDADPACHVGGRRGTRRIQCGDGARDRGQNLLPEVIGAGVRGLLDNPVAGFYVLAETERVLAALMITKEWATGETAASGGSRASMCGPKRGVRASTGDSIATSRKWRRRTEVRLPSTSSGRTARRRRTYAALDERKPVISSSS